MDEATNAANEAAQAVPENPVRKGEVVEHVYEPPTSAEGSTVWPFRISKFNNQPHVLVRSTSASAINADSSKRIADDAKKKVAQYATCGIEAVSAGYPVDTETGELAQLDRDAKKQKPFIYERRYRINVGMSQF